MAIWRLKNSKACRSSDIFYRHPVDAHIIFLQKMSSQ